VKDASGQSNNNYVLDASKFNLKSLQKDLCLINDPRGKQGQRYRFLPLLSLCIAATISGYTQYRQIADWIANLPAPDRARFGLRGDCVPDETTISQFLRKIDPEQLQTVLSGWLQKTYQKDAQFSTVTLDGKALRATSSDTKEQRAFLNVFASELGIVIAHKPTSKGGGEKNTAREVLRSDIDLEGKIVLADAIHTDRTTIKEIENKKASYVFTVKGNQRYLEEELADIFKHTREQYPELLYSHECIEKGHGRLERRSISVLSTEHTKLLFPGVQQVAHLRRTRENLKTGRKSEDEVFLISDSPFERVTAEQLMKLKREYWEIENKLHYRRDFVFGEDRSTIRAQHGPQNMASLCNFAIGLLTNLGIDNIKRCVDNLRHDPQCLIRQPVLDDRRMAA
jgi:predicted transposase YbfD/YdcC